MASARRHLLAEYNVFRKGEEVCSGRCVAQVIDLTDYASDDEYCNDAVVAFDLETEDEHISNDGDDSDDEEQR